MYIGVMGGLTLGSRPIANVLAALMISSSLKHENLQWDVTIINQEI